MSEQMNRRSWEQVSRSITEVGYALVGLGKTVADSARDEDPRTRLSEAADRTREATTRAGEALGQSFKQMADRGREAFPHDRAKKAKHQGEHVTGAHEDYERMTVEELRERASDLDIDGRSKMNKDELVTALRDHEPSMA